MITEIITLMGSLNTAHDFFSKMTGIFNGSKTNHNFFSKVTGIFNGSKDENARYLNQINENLKNINSKLKFERLSDSIIYTPLYESVRDVTQTQQRIITDLRDVRASLEPVQWALGGEIVSSAMIETPNKMQNALSRSPWEVFSDIRPAHLAVKPNNPDLVPIFFKYQAMYYIGWFMRGALIPSFDCEFSGLWTPNLSIVSERGQEQWSESSQGKGYIERIGNVDLSMIYIEGGSFQMGSNERDSEKPIHQATVKPFYMGKTPVTQEQYQSVMDNNPSHFKGENHPVECVSWRDAMAFCEELSKMTGKTYRLPSETEWEYACRAGSATKWNFGDNEILFGKYVWYRGNSGGQTHPVEKKPANAFGLYDMHGNVCEWCLDDWFDSYRGAPVDGSAWSDSKNSNKDKVLRGGSWYSDSNNTRSACRFNYSSDNTFPYLGFRILRTL